MKKFNQGYRVLFVDDDRIWGNLFFKWYGENTNYSVAHAFDAIETMAYLLENNVDLVVTKVITDRFNVKEIVYTAGNFPGERDQILANGAHSHLFKPLSMDALATAIVTVMEKNLSPHSL